MPDTVQWEKQWGTPVRRGPNNDQSNNQMPLCESAPENTESDNRHVLLGSDHPGHGSA
jgi:hypothetical protein